MEYRVRRSERSGGFFVRALRKTRMNGIPPTDSRVIGGIGNIGIMGKIGIKGAAFRR